MQVPTITPFDVSTPIQRFGQATAQAFHGVGDAVDNYNRMDLMMKDATKRKEMQNQIIKMANLDPALFPETKSAEELSQMTARVTAAQKAYSEFEQLGGGGTAQKEKLLAVAVGADNDTFYREMGKLDAVIEAKKKEQEGEAEGQRLQDVSTGLGPVHEIPSLSGLSDEAASQRMRDMQIGTQTKPQAASPGTGEISKEGLYKAVRAANIDVTKTGKDRLEAAANQYRSEKDIETSGFREANLSVARNRLGLAAKKLAQDATFRDFALTFNTLIRNNQTQDARQKMFAEAKNLRSEAEVMQSKGYDGAEEKVQAAEALESAFAFSEDNSQVLQDLASDLTAVIGKKYPAFSERRDSGIIEKLKVTIPNWGSLSKKQQRIEIDKYQRKALDGSAGGGAIQPPSKPSVEPVLKPSVSLVVGQQYRSKKTGALRTYTGKNPNDRNDPINWE